MKMIRYTLHKLLQIFAITFILPLCLLGAYDDSSLIGIVCISYIDCLFINALLDKRLEKELHECHEKEM